MTQKFRPLFKSRIVSGNNQLYLGVQIMKILILYDSMYGNTEKIAQTIGTALTGDVKVIPVSEANTSDLESLDTLIVGSPTHGARPTPAIQQFIEKLDSDSLTDVKVASFDTRLSVKAGNVGIRIIAGLAGGFGYSAKHIANSLQNKGGDLVKSPEGFIVKGGKGPLVEGELERATSWAQELIFSG
jgi:flavodoxin